MWIANAEFDYWSGTSNLFDTFISINWILLAFLRFFAPLILPENLIYSASGKDDLNARNKMTNIIYMFLFGIQMCLLYLRFATILSRSRTLGPFVRMTILR